MTLARSSFLHLAIAAFLAAFAAPAAAETKREKAEELVVDATETVRYFAQDSAFEPLWELADDAKALIVIPNAIRGGFIIGGSGGNALMIARDERGGWTEPTFFTIGSVSLGFQAGLEGSETVLAVMTQRGVERLLSTTVKLGADVSIAAGPVGAGAKAQTADILAFSRSRGLYGGVSLEGAILKTRRSWNEAFYGADVSPVDIVYRERARNAQSAPLHAAAFTLARQERPARAPDARNRAGEPAIIAPVQVDPLGPASEDGFEDAPLEDGEYEDDEVYGAPL